MGQANLCLVYTKMFCVLKNITLSEKSWYKGQVYLYLVYTVQNYAKWFVRKYFSKICAFCIIDEKKIFEVKNIFVDE